MLEWQVATLAALGYALWNIWVRRKLEEECKQLLVQNMLMVSILETLTEEEEKNEEVITNPVAGTDSSM